MTYTASFVAGSDPEFDVVPASGELLPQGTSGTVIKVTFLPPKYGKLYHGTLLVKVSDVILTKVVLAILLIVLHEHTLLPELTNFIQHSCLLGAHMEVAS